jgi:DNA repair protein RecN (Recombination protein N)
VLCVTHLAQVAAFADTQVVVEKGVVDIAVGGHDGSRVRTTPRTVAFARVVDGDGRVAELSRMLAGVGESDHARRHAEELLETARALADRTAS